MSLEDFLDDDFIKIGLDCVNQDLLFQTLYQEAYSKGYVSKQFLEKIKEREESFPTGLSINNYNVAIPHTDPEYVFKQFIAITTLKRPIPFQLMDDRSKKVNVKIVILLGLNEPHDQLNVLQQLIQMIQDEKKIEQIASSTSVKEIRHLFIQ